MKWRSVGCVFVVLFHILFASDEDVKLVSHDLSIMTSKIGWVSEASQCHFALLSQGRNVRSVTFICDRYEVTVKGSPYIDQGLSSSLAYNVRSLVQYFAENCNELGAQFTSVGPRAILQLAEVCQSAEKQWTFIGPRQSAVRLDRVNCTFCKERCTCPPIWEIPAYKPVSVWGDVMFCREVLSSAVSRLLQCNESNHFAGSWVSFFSATLALGYPETVSVQRMFLNAVKRRKHPFVDVGGSFERNKSWLDQVCALKLADEDWQWIKESLGNVRRMTAVSAEKACINEVLAALRAENRLGVGVCRCKTGCNVDSDPS